MGLSSSQARLLTLTARMHDIEYKAQRLEAQKLQMANESRRVYETYLDALDKTKIQFKTINPNGSITFVDATYNILREAGYKFKIEDCREVWMMLIGTYPNPWDDNITGSFIKEVPALSQNEALSEGYTVISSADDLFNMTSTGKYILAHDIDMAGREWTPIQNFSGVFNGNGHVIRNVVVNGNLTGSSYEQGIGFFGSLNGGTIENVGIENITLNNSGSNTNIGGLVGKVTNGTLDNCYVNGVDISESGASVNNAGGLVGAVRNYIGGGVFGEASCTIDGCYVDNLNIHKGSSSGGMIGSTYSNSNVSISNSFARGSVSGGSQTTNAIVGDVTGDIIVSGSNFEGVTSTFGHSYYDNNAHRGVDIDSDPMPRVNPPIINDIDLDRYLSDELKNSTEWLVNLLNSGYLIIQKPDKDGEYYDTSVAVDTNLQEASDETEIRKAEAKYEADMKRIDMKDRRYDTELAALDNERNAVKQEMETVKTVAKDNVDRTFRLFS